MKTESNAAAATSYTGMTDTISVCFNSLWPISDLISGPTAAREPLSARVRAVFTRLPSTEEMEGVFSRLRGVDLIMATLAYGLGVRVSDLRRVRVRDVNLMTRQIVLDGVARPLPAMIVDDIRDYISERLCGSEASVSVARREQRLFSEDDLQRLFRHVSEYQRSLALRRSQQATEDMAAIDDGPGSPLEPLSSESVLTERCLNRIFRLLGRFHARGAARKGARLRSPLDLFDKGPRIVRRGRWGVVDAYYLWRAVYPQCA